MGDTERRKIGEVIKQARKAKGLTQKELAERMGVTQSIIANYETGKQNLTYDTLYKIADTLELKLNIRFE